MAVSSINAMVPPPRSSRRATSAHPPVYNVPTMKEWKAQRERASAIPLWRRLIGRA